MKISKIIFILSVLILASCSTPYVATDYDRAVDFNNLKTYNYFTNIDWNGLNELDQKRFIEAIDDALQSKNWVKSEKPQILIDIKPQQRIVRNVDTHVGIGTGSYGGGFGTSMSVGIPIQTQKLESNFIIEMINPQNQNLIWQGVFRNQSSKGKQNIEIIPSAVQRIFKDFPPEQK
ncbi:DUF4136 domain-containing protein [Weeksellaceae bacterium TAE3-ERU29]|nr:DUF4136 domain-containing protein [Weeksellaceae bacterium TAE3-ERU29]